MSAPQNVILFGSRLSPFVEKVARALQLKGVAFTLAEPKSLKDFTRWNPKTGKMPVLEIDGERLDDSTFILQELDRRFPDSPLLSTEPTAAAMQRLLEDWSDESLYWQAMALRWTKANAPATADQLLRVVPGLLRPAARVFLTRKLRGMAAAQGMGRLDDEVLLRELGERLDDLVVALGVAPFFFGSKPSIADLAVFGQLSFLRSGSTPDAAEIINQREILVSWERRVDKATASSA